MLNKPPGLATQGGTKTTQHLDRLLDGLGDDRGRPKLVHRLDKDTSGALLVARTARAAGHFAKSFSGRTAKKVYWALVVGIPESDEGTIDAPLAKQPGTGGEKMHIDEENGLAGEDPLADDRPGRQSRRVGRASAAHGAHAPTPCAHGGDRDPIVGDAKYGGPEAFLTGGISRKLHLHARRIRIDAPEGRKIDVTAELPPHFAETLARSASARSPAIPCRWNKRRRPRQKSRQRKAAAAAKTKRRERRGERRSRGRPDEAEASMNRLAIFDCDGTLVDSGATIHARACGELWAERARGAAARRRRKVIGLSLTEAMAALLPGYRRAALAPGRGLQARLLGASRCGAGRRAFVRRRARVARRLEARRLAARGCDRQVGPGLKHCLEQPRHPRALRVAADRRPASVQAAPVDGRAGDRRCRRGARNDASSSAIRASTWRWRPRPARRRSAPAGAITGRGADRGGRGRRGRASRCDVLDLIGEHVDG